MGVAALMGLLFTGSVHALFYYRRKMVPILPRVFLWSELVSIDEFFQLDPINEDIYEVFLTLREDPFNIQADALKVFNEVYYQVTRMCYEYPMPADLDKYIADIKANLGWNYSAELVMSMAYQIISFFEKKERPVNKFFTKAIYEKYVSCKYWEPFEQLFFSLKKKNRPIIYPFPPQPVPIAELADFYFDWAEITHNYDLSCIEHVINLWDYNDEKSIAAEFILNSLNSSLLPKKKKVDMAQIKRFLESYMTDPEDWPQKVSEYTESFYEVEIDNLLKSQERLEKLVQELETENEKLKSFQLKDKDKNVHQERSFTLSLIVDYCKKRVDWTEAMYIVAMLNRLLRGNATEEECEIVDSIESEFINRNKPATPKKELVYKKYVETEIHTIEAGGTGVKNETKKD